MAWKDYETLDCRPEELKPEERQRIIEKYPELAEACLKYPRKVLQVRGTPTLYKPPHGYAKDGFVEKFCRD